MPQPGGINEQIFEGRYPKWGLEGHQQPKAMGSQFDRSGELG